MTDFINLRSISYLISKFQSALLPAAVALTGQSVAGSRLLLVFAIRLEYPSPS
jgi:hypothetical protein